MVKLRTVCAILIIHSYCTHNLIGNYFADVIQYFRKLSPDGTNFFYKPTHCQKQRFQPQFKLWKACCCIVSKSQLKSKPPMIWKSAKQDTFRLSFLKRLLSYTPKRRVVGGLCPDNLYGLVGIFFRRQGESQEIFSPLTFLLLPP